MALLCPRTCKISDELFQNYEVIIDLINYNNLDSICTYVTQNLICCLKKNNLHHLSSLVSKKNFHIHNRNLEELYNGEIGDIIWVCCHGCNKNKHK